jgi:RND family efflux transporter MFP subunit
MIGLLKKESSRSTMKRWIAILVIAAVGGGGLFYWLRLGPSQTAAAAPSPAGSGAQRPAGGGGQTIAVEAVPVARVTLRDLGTFSGSLLARSTVQVAARIAGRLERLSVDIGDRVEQGRLLAVLDSEEYVQQLEQARAELQVAQANRDNARITLEVAGRDLERAKALREKKVASESELDQADAQRRKAEALDAVAVAQVRQKEAALRGAELRVSQTQIRAQWDDGSAVRVVGERYAEPGALLRANDPIVSLLDIGALVAVVQATEQSYGKIGVGQRVEVRSDAVPGRVFAGTVSRIAPFLREATRQAEVRVEVPNPDAALKPGMPVQLAFEFGRRENVVAVPSAALTRRNEQQGVFMVDEATKRARFVEVQTGFAEGALVEVLDRSLNGLVVTVGQHLLEDGAAVIVSRGTGPGSGPQQPAASRDKQRSGS